MYICIYVPVLEKLQPKKVSIFGGLESLINSFNNVLFGYSGRFSQFIDTMRSITFTDKKFLTDVASSIQDGVKKPANVIFSNAFGITDLLLSITGIGGNVIRSAKNFQRSLDQNLAGYSSLFSEAGSGYKASRISSDELNKAVKTASLAAGSRGNANGTANLFRALAKKKKKTNDGQQFITPFTAAGVQLTCSVTAYASPARVKSVLSKYKPAVTPCSSTVNAMNSVSNAAASSRGALRGAIDNSLTAYTIDASEANCGCSNSKSFASSLAILASLLVSQLLAPSGSCRLPNTTLLFARPLSV
ncbi:hypothetical protein BB560_002773 [Smittium megazygosporum]|uniref:Uncharacterized protein n=1 Tax=Smittium megazygosporum TaxID=133381 RepID=A0A2T9ZDY7_9FUNG|nr:hypothetical protein BB560_002773 [Smittium megazygosporum]